MALWCEGFPVVTVPQSDQPKHVTFIYPYYENPDFLRTQLEGWARYPPELARHLSVVVVDDGSPTSPAEDVLRRSVLDRINGVTLPLEMRLFRIEVDVRWGWPIARNVGAKYSSGWLLLTDMDHVVPVETARSLVYGQHDPKRVYAFDRTGPNGERVKRDGKPMAPHSASFFMTNGTFWKIGGYDERAAGFYGNDGPYRTELARHAKINVLSDRLILREYDGDSSTEAYARKQPEDAKRPKWQKPHLTLSFPYHEVAL